MALSPMMQQYLRIHDAYPDCLLLFRLGDFYELFFEDAKTASKELELTLTGKDCGLEERAPMCGVPFHSVNTYIEKLIEKGYKVAICEQMEDPALAKGLVDRDVVRVITAGTVTDPTMLEDKVNNFLMCVFLDGKHAGIAWTDVSTGEFYVMEPELNLLSAQIARIQPMEVICNDAAALVSVAGSSIRGLSGQPQTWFQRKNAEETLCSHFRLTQLTSLGLEDRKYAACAAGAMLKYLLETQKNSLEHIRSLRFAENGRTMLLDQNTRRNLELTESLRGDRKKGTLLGLIDKTSTAMGGRLLRSWVEQPLLDPEEINSRLDAVEELVKDRVLGMTLSEELEGVYDMERLMNKVAYRNMNARDCLALCASLKRIPGIRSLLWKTQSREMIRIREELDPLEDLTGLLDRAINPDAPVVITEGGIIREGYSAVLDEYREAQTSGKQWILDLESKEREATGIRNLRIQYNKVFGYYIEVTKSFLGQVPDRYIRKQTLTNAERFMTPELKEVEQNLKDGEFIPNDTLLDCGENRMMIITGPNMAGKSTYMRQVALICLMAQIGSFVPAKEACLPVCDRIFTRVGASDDLASGQSTFMVEMSETAHILRNATRNSLIILDEIGRGTSTFDGLSIAWAVVEYIADREKIGAKTLFATHYHELSELEGHLEGVKNYCISVKEHGEDVLFLRKIIRGGADKSFGVHVARLAGVPHPVIVRAHEIQARLEVSDINQNKIGQNILGEESVNRKNEQVDLFEYKKDEIIQEIQQIDVMAITPMDAMNKLFLLKEKARKL